MTEADLKDRIMRVLRGVPDAYFWRQGATPYGRSGIADILGCWSGQMVAIEVKMPGNKPTPAQCGFINNIKETGGLAFIAYTLDDVLDFIKEHSHTKD